MVALNIYPVKYLACLLTFGTISSRFERRLLVILKNLNVSKTDVQYLTHADIYYIACCIRFIWSVVNSLSGAGPMNAQLNIIQKIKNKLFFKYRYWSAKTAVLATFLFSLLLFLRHVYYTYIGSVYCNRLFWVTVEPMLTKAKKCGILNSFCSMM